ncbi:MAG: 2-phospho-L-lactate transferase [Acidimicrobiia bacterium]
MSRTTLLAGGVGGARLARGLAAVLEPAELTVIVNVGDDDMIYGTYVATDLDTVTYTLAGRQGPHGWGLTDDTFTVMAALEALGLDTRFRLGDNDLATCLLRTAALDGGEPLSRVTATICDALGVRSQVLPASDDPIRTKLLSASGEWLDFQEYFVRRGHQDEITSIRYEGAATATPAPGVLEATTDADLVIIAPSNPPLSIHPILAVDAISAAVRAAERVIAVSPLFGGKALKGPADRVMASLGLPAGNAGVLAAYEGLLSDLVVDIGDSDDVDELGGMVAVHATDTRFAEAGAAARFATWLLGLP